MIRRFEDFTSDILTAYKYVIRIKAYEMNNLGMKGSHIMCLYYLSNNLDGYTAMELVDLCKEDKAQTVKAISYLQRIGYIATDKKGGNRKYIKFVITPKGLEIYNNINQLITDVLSQCEDGLSTEELESFYDTFKKINIKLSRIHEEMEKN